MAGAEDLGRRLLGEVEVVALDEIFSALSLLNHHDDDDDDEGARTQLFAFEPLDRLLRTAAEARAQRSKTDTAPPPTIVEFMSLAPGGGKTHLLYYLCARAVLPKEAGGNQSSVVVIDTDGKFSVARLGAQIELLLRQRRSSRDNDENDKNNNTDADEETIQNTILTSLKHIHIFRPQTLTSIIATLDALPSYLFTSSRHFSFDRRVGFIALDSASAFYWADRAETEDAAFLASAIMNSNPGNDGGGRSSSVPPPQRSGYGALATAFKTACRTFHCPGVVTTWYLGPHPSLTSAPQEQHQQQQGPHPRSFRPSLPPPFANLPTLRLIVRRVPVRKFPPGMDVQDALREAGDRLKVVAEGRFEGFVCEWGLDERVLRGLSEVGRGFGFGFRVGGEGLVVDE